MVKSNSTVAVPAVQVIKKTVFALKKRPFIAPKGLTNVTFLDAAWEAGGVGDKQFSRIRVKVDGADAKGNRFTLTKDYNVMPNKRGAASFVSDYNDWSGAGLTEDDMYNELDYGDMFVGKTAVIEIEHRKIGKEWEAYIKAFHPADYTGESATENGVTETETVGTAA